MKIIIFLLILFICNVSDAALTANQKQIMLKYFPRWVKINSINGTLGQRLNTILNGLSEVDQEALFNQMKIDIQSDLSSNEQIIQDRLAAEQQNNNGINTELNSP
jgi:hypothetical protein